MYSDIVSPVVKVGGQTHTFNKASSTGPQQKLPAFCKTFMMSQTTIKCETNGWNVQAVQPTQQEKQWSATDHDFSFLLYAGVNGSLTELIC